jgi:hypothetical protein
MLFMPAQCHPLALLGIVLQRAISANFKLSKETVERFEHSEIHTSTRTREHNFRLPISERAQIWCMHLFSQQTFCKRLVHLPGSFRAK